MAMLEGELLEGRLWYREDGSELTLGVTSRAVEEVGSIEKVDFPTEGISFEKEEVCASLEGSLGRLEIIAPKTGTVQEINEAVQNDFSMIAEDPLEEGWLIKFKI